MLAAARGEWSGSLFFAQRALTITARSRSYINEPESWGARPYDLAALAAYRLGLYDDALRYGARLPRWSRRSRDCRRICAFMKKRVKNDLVPRKGDIFATLEG